MRRKSIPAAAPVLMSSSMERFLSIDACLRTETLYMDNDNNMMSEKSEQTIQKDNDQFLSSGDVPSMFYHLEYSGL